MPFRFVCEFYDVCVNDSPPPLPPPLSLITVNARERRLERTFKSPCHSSGPVWKLCACLLRVTLVCLEGKCCLLVDVFFPFFFFFFSWLGFAAVSRDVTWARACCVTSAQPAVGKSNLVTPKFSSHYNMSYKWGKKNTYKRLLFRIFVILEKKYDTPLK